MAAVATRSRGRSTMIPQVTSLLLMVVLLSKICFGFCFLQPNTLLRNGVAAAPSSSRITDMVVMGSFFEDLFGGIVNATKSNSDTSNKKNPTTRMGEEALFNLQEKHDENDSLSLKAFQAQVQKQQQRKDDFDGYAMRDVVKAKWGHCFDMDFQRVDAFGMRELYLNVLPFRLGMQKFRHETELDYLCHLQAVVEILQKYNQLDYVLYQMEETKKKPRAGTSPLVAVPLRLDLTPAQINNILGYR